MQFNFIKKLFKGVRTLLKIWIIPLTLFLGVVSVFFTYFAVTHESLAGSPDPEKVIGWILVDLILFLVLMVFGTSKLLKLKHKGVDKGSRLQNRMIYMFSLVAVIPTIIVSIFSVYFFYVGIQTWFDKRVTSALEQSLNVADSYIAENKLSLKKAAKDIALDLGDMLVDNINNPYLFKEVLNTYAEMFSLSDAVVFNAVTNQVVAQSDLSFSLIYQAINIDLVRKADRQGTVEIHAMPEKIIMLSKLKGYSELYLVVARMIDKNIINYIDKTHGAAQEYSKLKKRIQRLQVEFLIIFIIVAILLVTVAICIGLIFATQITKPIQMLVDATEKIKTGDLSVRVKEGPAEDEIGVLSQAFNRMVRQLDHQQKDLVIAQRASAWSEVARRVAHEIKNPLTPIQLSTEMLIKKFSNDASDKEVFKRHCNTILRHVKEIMLIVQEFVNFAKFPNPKFTHDDIVVLLKDFIESKKALNDKYNYFFKSDLTELKFDFDKVLIGQVLNNLILNSEQALETIDKVNRKIYVELFKNNNNILILVRDNGPGFPVNFIDKVSEPYFTTHSKGMGLGLAIVKKIIEDHGGKFLIYNNEEGACVELTFELGKLNKILK